MKNLRDRVLFWCFLAVEAAGSQAILWRGIPIYRRLLLPGTQGAATTDFAVAFGAVIAMQIGHWGAFRLQPRLRFRRNIVLGHIVVSIAELSLFFINALAVVVVFDRMGELQFVFWKLLILAAIIFAVCCYKYQLGTLAEAMIQGEKEIT